MTGKGMTNVIRSVGRLNVPGMAAPGYLGTVFVVGDDLVMTNRHVVCPIAQKQADDSWILQSQFKPNIDFVSENGSGPGDPFAVIGVALVHPALDLALLRVASKSQIAHDSLPAPLPISANASEIVPERKVYVVGYPNSDPDGDPNVAEETPAGRLFGEAVFAGEIMDVDAADHEFTHDCSTLKGNSGSCVVDFGNHRVIGLHMKGAYRMEKPGSRAPDAAERSLARDDLQRSCKLRYMPCSARTTWPSCES